jgi:hypothetical protein
MNFWSAAGFMVLQGVAVSVWPAQAGSIEFNRDVRPILSENCFYCHGQDAKKREADLRLDERVGATRDLGGYAAIVPGRPEESEMVKRLLSHDQDELMPPPKSNRKVSPAQVEVIKQWISEGASYEKHWAYVAPKRAPLPAVGKEGWDRHPLDRWVLARLEKEGLGPSREATPATWLRRVSLDLTGLPLEPGEAEAFESLVKLKGERAYEEAVNRLLDSPHYGERMAIDWLDAARYADSHGFNNDGLRTMWRWRDWVIDAFNANLPYDQFITEQLAGDLLPEATLEQRIATGFSRNHVINSEGGIIDEEYRVEYVADRVRTTSTAWLGLTMECARCHDHKYDEVTQKDYFRLFAFFNNVPEHGEDGRVANAVPQISAPTKVQQELMAGQLAELVKLDEALVPLLAGQVDDEARLQKIADEAGGIKKSMPLTALLRDGMDGVVGNGMEFKGDVPVPKIAAELLDFKSEAGLTLSFWLKPDATNGGDVPLLSALDYRGSPESATYGGGQELRLIDGEFEWRASSRYPVYAMVVRTEGALIRAGAWRHVVVSIAHGIKAEKVRVFVDGKELPLEVRYDGLQRPVHNREFLVGADNGAEGIRWLGELDELAVIAKPLGGDEVMTLFLADALPFAAQQVTAPWAKRWRQEALLADDVQTKALVARRRAVWEAHLATRRALPTSMVMAELPEQRPTHVLNRGSYDAPGELVEPGVPEALIAPWPAGVPRNRLGLAKWFTQPQHPLTARVVVNRLWAQLFGTGIVKTLEDFGSQSEWPSHPELLDWLARDFIDGGWDVKALVKTLVLSSTYRQSSEVTAALAARDPENRLLARGPRVRLPAEIIRDQALAVSGLLMPKLGGPSVYPYQPEKLYDGVVVGTEYPGSRWQQGVGEDLYRRSLYTFWKRTVTHPAMLTLDAPDREFCSVRRSRTNTPMQALLLWNEPGYLEAARHLAGRMIKEGGADDHARLSFGFQLVTGRRAEDAELGVVHASLVKLREQFVKAPAEAEAFLKVGSSPQDASIPNEELAAMMGVASMLLNLDETITKN